jgi:hypothetical protein
MKFPVTRRWMMLGSALALSLMAAGWLDAGGTDSGEVIEVVEPVRVPAPNVKAKPEGAPQEALIDLHLEQSRRQENGQSVKDLFPSKSWYVPPPSPEPLSPPSPSAPPLPFLYLGKMMQEGGLTVFLSKQDRNYAAKEGDVIDGTYRVDSIKGALMELTYIPLDLKQTMHIGEQN